MLRATERLAALLSDREAMERLAAARSDREDNKRKAMEVATNHNKYARAVKHCGPLVYFFNKWSLELDTVELSPAWKDPSTRRIQLHYKWIFHEAPPPIDNPALCWAVYMRRVFSENKLPYDSNPAMEFERSVPLCAWRRPRNAGEFREFATELFSAIFPPGDTPHEVRTETEDGEGLYDGAVSCTPGASAVRFRLSYDVRQKRMYIGTLADHTKEGRSVEALAEFFARRGLVLNSDRLRELHRNIFGQGPPAASFPADAWAAFLKRVLDENELPYPRHSDVFERSMSLCLENTVTYRDSFAAGLANLLFPSGAPCTMYDADDDNPSIPNQIMVPFRKHAKGPLFGFLFTVDQPGVEFGILV